MFSSIAKLFCCKPNESNEDRLDRINSSTMNSNFLTPMSTITSTTQKFLSLIQPHEGDITTIGLKALEKLNKYTIIKIAFINTHCLMLIDNDYERILAGFGSNMMGQLGLNIIPNDINHNYYKELTIIQLQLIKNKRIIDFATCEKYSIVLLDCKEYSKRKLICFGTNPWSNSNSSSSNHKDKVNEMDIKIDLFSIDKVYLTHNGSMLILQSKTHGLYIKDNSSHNNTFRLLHQFNQKIVSLSIMNQFIVVALSNNTIVTFGSNFYINNSDNINQNRKRNNSSSSNIFSNHMIKKVACGLNHALILCQDGAVFSFGENKYNQCNGEYDEYLNDPRAVVFDDNEKLVIVDIACGDTFSLAITNNGNTFIWGTSDFFFVQDESPITDPKKIDKLYLDNVKAIYAFGNSALCFGEMN